MKKNPTSKSGLFNPRVLLAFALCSVGVLLAMYSFAGMPSSGAKGRSSANTNVSSAPSLGGPTTNLSNGITFDHTNWNDPIRMVGEPDIEIDNHNGIYVSGPGGSTTQTSWFWKSEDNGLQWHIIGVAPQKSNGQNGGGDTEIALARNRDVFASDLQTLQCNSTFRSFDEGKTFVPGEGCFPETDRQWMGIYDPNNSSTGRRIYLAANGTANGCYFLVSTDNGVTYTPADTNPADLSAVDPVGQEGCDGRMAVDPSDGTIYEPLGFNNGDHIWKSTNGGASFTDVGTSGAAGNFFAPLFLDTAGNLYQAWVDDPNQNSNHAFISVSVDHGATWTKFQVSTGAASPVGTSPDLHQNVFPWGVAGDPGRVAVAWYGTTDTQKDTSVPAYGGTNALWQVYSSFSTDLVTCNPTCTVNPNPHFTQVQVDEHVFHRGAICLGGFPGCLEKNSDRSLADFFVIEKDTQGRAFIAYNENSDLSDVTLMTGTEFIGKPINAVIRLRTGPSLFAAKGNLLPDPTPANVNITSASRSAGTVSVAGTHGLPPGNWAPDAAGDAPFPVVPVASANHPALDILEASVGDDGTNLTFTLKMADLSPTALADAATAGGTPTWMVTWWEGKNGLGPAAMTPPYYSHWFVKWLGATNFVFGKVSSIDFPALGAPTPKFLTYVASGIASGTVVGNVVTITVPLANVGPLVSGDKIDQIIAYSLIEKSDATLNDWADQVKSFSYIIGTPAAKQHFPDGYVEVSLDNFATSTRATLNNVNNSWTASIPSSTGSTVCARQVLAKDLYTPVWDDVQAGPVSCSTIPSPVLTSVVSRMTHGGAGTFNIGLPLTGTRGVECRSSTSLGAGNYTLVFTFLNNLVSVSGASVTGHDPSTETGAVSGSVVVGPTASLTAKQCAVNLTNVSNAQYITVTLNGVLDATGASSNIVSPQMGVLIGDVNATIGVDGNDVAAVQSHTRQPVNSDAQARFDVNATGGIDGNDVALTQNHTRTSLPSTP
jgi:hypothetical protein